MVDPVSFVLAPILPRKFLVGKLFSLLLLPTLSQVLLMEKVAMFDLSVQIYVRYHGRWHGQGERVEASLIW
jgi:hypothetical protein